jgi:hypothetical protein
MPQEPPTPRPTPPLADPTASDPEGKSARGDPPPDDVDNPDRQVRLSFLDG